jgi:hypothetical protein
MITGPPGFHTRKIGPPSASDAWRMTGTGGMFNPDRERDRIASVKRKLDRFTWLFLLTGLVLTILIWYPCFLLFLVRESPSERVQSIVLGSIKSIPPDTSFTFLFVMALINSSPFLYALYKYMGSREKRSEAGFPELLGFYRATWCSYIGAFLAAGAVALLIGVEWILNGDGDVVVLFVTPFPYVAYWLGPVVGYIVGDAIFIPPKPKEPDTSGEGNGMKGEWW